MPEPPHKKELMQFDSTNTFEFIGNKEVWLTVETQMGKKQVCVKVGDTIQVLHDSSIIINGKIKK